MRKDIAALAEILGIPYDPEGHLEQAVVHRSYLNEHPTFPLAHNERLEFLGDAVLELIVTEHLFGKYPNPEGDLTSWRSALVNGESLATIAQELGVDPFLYRSRGEEKEGPQTKARRTMLANAFEAIIGAMYLDFGWEVTRDFVARTVITRLPTVLEEGSYLDPKSRFQESAQSKVAMTPSYKVLEESGPDHNKIFIMGVYLGEELIAQGTGSSKQEAQAAAAAHALVAKGW